MASFQGWLAAVGGALTIFDNQPQLSSLAVVAAASDCEEALTVRLTVAQETDHDEQFSATAILLFGR